MITSATASLSPSSFSLEHPISNHYQPALHQTSHLSPPSPITRHAFHIALTVHLATPPSTPSSSAQTPSLVLSQLSSSEPTRLTHPTRSTNPPTQAQNSISRLKKNSSSKSPPAAPSDFPAPSPPQPSEPSRDPQRNPARRKHRLRVPATWWTRIDRKHVWWFVGFSVPFVSCRVVKRGRGYRDEMEEEEVWVSWNSVQCAKNESGRSRVREVVEISVECCEVQV